MILIVNCGSTKVPQIEEITDSFEDYTTLSMYDFSNEDFTKYIGIIISGAPLLLSQLNPEPYLLAFEKIKTINIPVLGICFGHQIIGVLHGARIALQKEERDWTDISFFKESKLLKSIPNECLMMQDHCESISIPNNFSLLGSSDNCINEAMQHNSKPIFGVQFHPEVSGNLGTRLIENFISICTELKAQS